MGYNVNCAIKALKEKDIKKALSFLEDRKIIFDEWSTGDIWQRFEDRIEDGDVFKSKMTEEKAREILELCIGKLDCEEGINWNVIDFHTDSILN